MAPASTCPGCAGAKSRRAQLCKACRLRAVKVGVDVVRHIPVATVPVLPRTPVQNRVFHGKLSDLAITTGEGERDLKRQALAWAASKFGRPIESSTELSEPEMERLLEWLDDRLDDVAAAAR